MNELIIPIATFIIWTIFSVIYIQKFKTFQLDTNLNRKSFWNNPYIFETIPSVFPTLGIFCTALGITLGIWDFNTTDIQGSIPELLKGLRLAFIATMGGIIGLIIFQKYTAIIQKIIDDDPKRPRKQTDEISALAELGFELKNLKAEFQIQNDKLIYSFTKELSEKTLSLKNEIILLSQFLNNDSTNKIEKLEIINKSLKNNDISFVNEFNRLREEQTKISEKANFNIELVITAMNSNNQIIRVKFDEFSDLLAKNNTEGLVLVMKNATEQFNAQMSELINKLVQENFKELNTSVQNLNDWQRENIQQISVLTGNFQKTTELFDITATTLKEVAINTKSLTDDDGKLYQIVNSLNRIMIEDDKFKTIVDKVISTIDILEKTTESFDTTTVKLNDWVKNEKNFKDSAEILIKKLEEFRDFNGDVWEKYRKEMQKSVGIIKETSSTLSNDIQNINTEFYSRLNDTLSNLDNCISRFIPAQR